MKLDFKRSLLAAGLMLLSGCQTTQPQPAGAARNAAVVTRFLDEVVNGGHVNLVDELWTPDLTWHMGGQRVHGRENYKRMLETSLRKTFTGMKLEIRDIVASGDKVVVRFTNSGYSAGPFLGLPPTHRRVKWHGIGIYRLENGRIAEAWFAEDFLEMLRQMDALKQPSQ